MSHYMNIKQCECYVNLIKSIGFKQATYYFGSGVQYDLNIGGNKYRLYIKKNSFSNKFYSQMHSSEHGEIPMYEEKIREYFKDIIRSNKLNSLL